MLPDMFLAGAQDGPDGDSVPNITPHRETGIGRWCRLDLEFLLEIGMLPDGDFVGGGMGEVVDETTSQLTEGDRAAMENEIWRPWELRSLAGSLCDLLVCKFKPVAGVTANVASDSDS